MGWARNKFNCEEIAKKLYKKNKQEREEIENFVMTKFKEMSSKIVGWEQNNRTLNICSDDGFSDVIYHVIGLGQKEYEKVLKNPVLLETRYRNEDYKESFAYCFLEPEKPQTLENKVQHFIQDIRNRKTDMLENLKYIENDLKQIEELVKDKK